MKSGVIAGVLLGVMMLLASWSWAEDAVTGLTPQQLLIQARSMFPREKIQVSGLLGTAEVRGQNERFQAYTLLLNWAGGVPRADCRLYREKGDKMPILRAELSRQDGAPKLVLFGSDGERVEGSRLNAPIGESDLTWMDLMFDFLWWKKVRRVPEEELEAKQIPTRISGRSDCVVLEAEPPVALPGLSAVRLWIDHGTGNLLQTEQLDEAGEPTRQMFVQRVGRENGRWVPREFRIRRLGRSHITRLLVSEVKMASFTSKGEEHD